MNKDYSKFIEYFQKNGFNTIPYLLKVFSFLPPSDRIEVLKSLVEKNPYELNLYDKLSMALLKNGEFNNSINLLKDAYSNNYVNSMQYQELKDKIEFLYRERGSNFGSAINYQMTLDLVKRDLHQDYRFGWSDDTIKAHKEFCNIMIEFCENQIL